MKLSKGFILTFSSAFFWAITIVITRFILQEGENTYNIIFWVALLAMPFWLFIFSKNFTEFKSVGNKNYLIILGMGVVGVIGVSIVEVFALKYSPALNYAFLLRTVILFTILFAYLFLGEPLTKKKISIAITILIGAYLLTTGGRLIFFSIGDLFTILQAALLAFGNTILGKMASKVMSANLGASASFLIGVLPISVIALLNNAIAIPKVPLLIFLLALLAMIMPMIRFRAYQNASASFIAMIYSFTPVIVALMAVPLLKESLTPIQLLGGALIILAGIGVEKLKI